MKESIGYTVTLNIVIIFITIIVAFFWFAAIYFRSNKASNIIIDEIEKSEGYNDGVARQIKNKLDALGYGSHSIYCAPTISDKASVAKKEAIDSDESVTRTCNLTLYTAGTGKFGYCVYECFEYDEAGQYEYYYFKIRTNMMIGIPIVNEILDFPIYSNTNRMYKFSKVG